MSERERIVTGVARLRRRRRFQLAFEWGFRGLLYGTLAAALLILVSKLWLLPVDPLWATGGIVIAAIAGFAVLAYLRPPSSLNIANEIDKRLGLRERVSSAMALGIADQAPAKRDPFVKALMKYFCVPRS